MIEGNAFYEPGEESSVVSLNQEVDIFASHMKIYTTDTDKYEDIMDEPVEMEVFDEDAWASNLMLGAVVALGFAACAVVVVASGGAALGAVALAGAAVGTGLITAGVAYADRKNKKNRSREEFIGELAIGAGIGMLTALGIVYAGPSLLVAGEQAGVEASYCLGANVLTTSVIPDIVASGGGVLLATDGAYILNELNAMNTGENLAVETVFDGDEENYEDFVMVLEMLNQAFGDLTARGYQRTSAENNSSNITQKNKEESSSETGLDIRNANDESGTETSRPTWRQSELDAAKDFPDYDAQKSFINGEEVPYGTKGSVRPDYYKDGYSVDIKNYNVESASGRSNLARNIEKQYYQRIENLPEGTKQSVMIDIRGQNVTDADLSALYDDIMKRTDNGVEILFKMD